MFQPRPSSGKSWVGASIFRAGISAMFLMRVQQVLQPLLASVTYLFCDRVFTPSGADIETKHIALLSIQYVHIRQAFGFGFEFRDVLQDYGMPRFQLQKRNDCKRQLRLIQQRCSRKRKGRRDSRRRLQRQPARSSRKKT